MWTSEFFQINKTTKAKFSYGFLVQNTVAQKFLISPIEPKEKNRVLQTSSRTIKTMVLAVLDRSAIIESKLEWLEILAALKSSQNKKDL